MNDQPNPQQYEAFKKAIHDIHGEVLKFVDESNLMNRHENPMAAVAGMIECAGDMLASIIVNGGMPQELMGETIERFAMNFAGRAMFSIAQLDERNAAEETEEEGV